jgi:hypothetical protein
MNDCQILEIVIFGVTPQTRIISANGWGVHCGNSLGILERDRVRTYEGEDRSVHPIL